MNIRRACFLVLILDCWSVQAADNASLVRKAASIVELLGSRLATPQEARTMLGLPAR